MESRAALKDVACAYAAARKVDGATIESIIIAVNQMPVNIRETPGKHHVKEAVVTWCIEAYFTDD